MSDSIGMSPAFNEQVKKTVRETLRRERSSASHNGRWHKKGSGGGSISVRFRIVAAGEACTNCFAQALVISGPTGIDMANTNALPGSTYDYDSQLYTIDVWDMGEGWLNHPPDELLNMIGHATWLRSYEDGPCAEPPGAKWEIISLQCPEEAVCK